MDENLKSIRYVKKTYSQLSLAEIDTVIENFMNLREQIEELTQKKQQENEKKAKALELASALLTEQGISFNYEELKAIILNETKRTKKVGIIEPKYRYTDLDGVEHTWTGRGRMPVELRNLIETNNTKKEDYLIHESQETVQSEVNNTDASVDGGVILF